MKSSEDIDPPRFGFAGAVLRPYLDLYRFDGRWYDPALGRFLSPAGWASDATNAYLFRSGNPQR